MLLVTDVVKLVIVTAECYSNTPSGAVAEFWTRATRFNCWSRRCCLTTLHNLFTIFSCLSVLYMRVRLFMFLRALCFLLSRAKLSEINLTSLPKVIWEEGRVAALWHTYAIKSPSVTTARPKFAPKYPFPWTDPQTQLPASFLDPSDL